MKTEKEFYEDSWNMTHDPQRHEFSFNIFGLWRRWRARKLRDVMDRSKAYWARKRKEKEREELRQKTEMMWHHKKQYEALLTEVRAAAVKEANRGMGKEGNIS